MTNTVLGSFGCESYEALAWHLASCHWKMQSVPVGLIRDLRDLDSLDLEALKQLRNKYVHPESEAVLGGHQSKKRALVSRFFIANILLIFVWISLLYLNYIINNHIMALTIVDDSAYIQNEINHVIQDQDLHRELSGALSILTQESQERVAGILRKKEGRVTMLDLEELLLEPV